MDAHFLIDALRFSVGGVIIAFGLVFVAGGTIGLLRFPDFYTRVHAASASDAVGGVIFVIGLSVLAWDAALSPRLLLLAALIAALAPTLAQLTTGAAHAGGLAPLAGRYVAPRPGSPRKEQAP